MSHGAIKVFISSTRLDLLTHRHSVHKAIDKMGLHPIGMEDFGAQPGDATEVSLAELEQCTLFVGLYAYRYGYRPSGELGITEQEYRRAKELNLPIFIFVADETLSGYEGWEQLDRFRESDGESIKLLEKFKQDLGTSHVWDTFTTPDQLASIVAATIGRWLQSRSSGQRNFPEDVPTSHSEPLVADLYGDLKQFLVSLISGAKVTHSRAKAQKYESLAELIFALSENRLQSGEWVHVKIIPSPFGPFLKNHFVGPFVGFDTRMRLGPPILSADPLMGFFAQATSNLMPVGLYPPVETNVNQACVYPADTNAFGFVGLFPGITDLVPCLPSLLASRYTNLYGVPCQATGIVRSIDSNTLAQSGFSPEDYEIIRQAGRIWFLDLTDDDSHLTPIGEKSKVEIWGALYGSGHLEIVEGSLQVSDVLETIQAAMKTEGLETTIAIDHGSSQTHGLYSTGFRILFSGQSATFSLHMDADLSNNFEKSRGQFDRVTNNLLSNLYRLCNDNSVELRNGFDLDFSYTNSTKAYTILRSISADQIRDPLAIAIRDWHRRRQA